MKPTQGARLRGEATHSNGTNNIRHAYVKYGDVVKELDEFKFNSSKVPAGGPNAFLFEYLAEIAAQPLLLISASTRNAHSQSGNIEAHVFRGTSQLHPHGTAVVRMVAFFKILFHLVKFRPNRILCGTLGFALWACYIYARAFSLPLVHSLHCRIDYDASPWYKRPTTYLDKFVLKHLSRVTCHGPFLRQQLLDIGVKASAIAEYDCGFRDMWEQLESRQEINDLTEQRNYKTITFLGRMEYTKGLFDLLYACTDRLAEDATLRLVYVGDGPDLLALKNKVTDLGLERQVLFLGRLPHEELAGIICQSYLVATPTQSIFPEGRCMATMEGLAMKIPVIAPNFGPFPYLVQHGVNGLLFSPDSIDDLRSQINAALDDPALYARLRDGALETSKKLLDPPVTFYKAVEWAFANYVKV
ncbi:MAG: glycosyltransferase family 4 protein [Gammaproteobacteria bacterium]